MVLEICFQTRFFMETNDYKEILERKKDVGVLVLQGRVMEWGFGKRLGTGGWSLAKGWLLRWGMAEECGFGRIGGVERILWKRLFQDCTLLPPPRMLG